MFKYYFFLINITDLRMKISTSAKMIEEDKFLTVF